MFALKTLETVNIIVVVLLTAAYFYQTIYTLIGLVRRKVKPSPEPDKLNRFAALICARNERDVISELIASLKAQNYPADLLDIYVLADNCTDDTAEVARCAGAGVWERSNLSEVGKGYALDCLLANIRSAKGRGYYAGYFVFDADNIVDPQFVREMNKGYCAGNEVMTCYRNSKNFGANWISTGYSVWFLREARFINYPRMLVGNSCAVSGTGFFVSDEVVAENGGWPFHLLTEDIQFSMDCVVKGRKIGYCDGAIVYDEQPTSFKQAWQQRLRWSKGFFQVDAKYLLPLLKGSFTSRGSKMSCYDQFMTIVPCVMLTVAAVVVNILMLFLCAGQPHHIVALITAEAGRYLLLAVVNYYLGLVLYALLTVCCEWKRINGAWWRKIVFLPFFPLFMATYIPITFQALFCKVQWTHIQHYKTGSAPVKSFSGHAD